MNGSKCPTCGNVIHGEPDHPSRTLLARTAHATNHEPVAVVTHLPTATDVNANHFSERSEFEDDLDLCDVPLDEPLTRIIDAEVTPADSNQDRKSPPWEIWLGLAGMAVFGWGLYSLAMYAWRLVEQMLSR